MKVFKGIWGLINFFDSIRLAKKIKNDPEKQPTSKKYGIKTILYSVGLVVGAVFVGLLFMFKDLFFNTASILGIILIVIIGIGMFLSLLNVIVSWILQIYINKKPITWISLVVMICAIVASAVIIWIMYGIG